MLKLRTQNQVTVFYFSPATPLSGIHVENTWIPWLSVTTSKKWIFPFSTYMVPEPGVPGGQSVYDLKNYYWRNKASLQFTKHISDASEIPNTDLLLQPQYIILYRMK